jgi:uncharacterized protein (TIGR01777 family)
VKIVITGGTGFLGTALRSALAADGHETVLLSRAENTGSAASQPPTAATRTVPWAPNGGTGPWAREIEGTGAVVNLAGESIAGRRWSVAQKERILQSRTLATQSLVAAIMAAASPPAVFVSGSAVGYYGPRGDEIVTEDTPAGRDFLAGVCVDWENQALKAGSRTRVACVRTGIVLDRRGGALPKMLPPFWLGAGGPVGTGRQYWPWIHLRDWVALVRWIITTPGADGAVNATAPEPVTNAEFARALGRAMHRPALLPTPGFALKALLGEMAGALLLSGQRAVPAKAERLGFKFQYRRVDEALNELF